jgi:hypothetical protein
LIPTQTDTVVLISSKRHIRLQGMKMDISFAVFELRLAPLMHEDAVALVHLCLSDSQVLF